EKGIGLYGLSHHAEAGNYHFENGTQVVTEISRVESVDLVSNPATNKSLWEDFNVMREQLTAVGGGLSPEVINQVREHLAAAQDLLAGVGDDDASVAQVGERREDWERSEREKPRGGTRHSEGHCPRDRRAALAWMTEGRTHSPEELQRLLG